MILLNKGIIFIYFDRVVTTEEGANLAKELDAHFIEVSAKSGSNVELLFK